MALAQPELQLHMGASPAAAVAAALAERAQDLTAALSRLADDGDAVAAAAGMIGDAIHAGRIVLACGNGGSAAEAQHLVAELVGRFRRERDAWPALALTADAAVITAIANDYGFESVFARQVAAFGQAEDVLVALSTSGSSPNVVAAAALARERGMRVVALTGQAPSLLWPHANAVIAVPATETALVQEVHSVLVHLLCEIVESRLTAHPSRDRKAFRP